MITDQELIDDLNRVYEKIGSLPSEYDYREHGNYSVKAVRSHFGKYTAGRNAAGLPDRDLRGRHHKIPREELLAELKRLGQEVDGTPTRNQMRAHGKYDSGSYHREFGDWSSALMEAGYSYDDLNRPGSSVAKRVTVACEVCGTERKRLQSSIEHSRNVFCSQDCLHEWRSTVFIGDEHPLTDRVEVVCDHCGDTKKQKPSVVAAREYNFCDYECMGKWMSENRSGKNSPCWRGGGELYRGDNWIQQRQKAIERDNYRCRRCGCSEKEHFEKYSRQLSVHHITSVREFYNNLEDGDWPDFEEMNALDNLATLCVDCHRKIEKLPINPEFH